METHLPTCKTYCYLTVTYLYEDYQEEDHADVEDSWVEQTARCSIECVVLHEGPELPGGSLVHSKHGIN